MRAVLQSPLSLIQGALPPAARPFRMFRSPIHKTTCKPPTTCSKLALRLAKSARILCLGASAFQCVVSHTYESVARSQSLVVNCHSLTKCDCSKVSVMGACTHCRVVNLLQSIWLEVRLLKRVCNGSRASGNGQDSHQRIHRVPARQGRQWAGVILSSIRSEAPHRLLYAEHVPITVPTVSVYITEQTETYLMCMVCVKPCESAQWVS